MSRRLSERMDETIRPHLPRKADLYTPRLTHRRVGWRICASTGLYPLCKPHFVLSKIPNRNHTSQKRMLLTLSAQFMRNFNNGTEAEETAVTVRNVDRCSIDRQAEEWFDGPLLVETCEEGVVGNTI
ncbi:hypothetical protein M7I_6424 [Glarea lozoyensis 74030]|uniref:Uncharacterized protein n=1 Tax=Glarea lozoyensis (strain ATCC 74030 / MF5533) TaxID=1104152 RepID=H0EUI9_GLAL7|nr:hypothetical protein M7I_6424 [Glarea lozoyensis 74030]